MCGGLTNIYFRKLMKICSQSRLSVRNNSCSAFLFISTQASSFHMPIQLSVMWRGDEQRASPLIGVAAEGQWVAAGGGGGDWGKHCQVTSALSPFQYVQCLLLRAPKHAPPQTQSDSFDMNHTKQIWSTMAKLKRPCLRPILLIFLWSQVAYITITFVDRLFSLSLCAYAKNVVLQIL